MRLYSSSLKKKKKNPQTLRGDNEMIPAAVIVVVASPWPVGGSQWLAVARNSQRVNLSR